MEIVFFLIIVALVSYMIYQSLPATKFAKANVLFANNKLKEAHEILQTIYTTHADAPAKIAECKFKYATDILNKNTNEALDYFNQIISDKKNLPAQANFELYEITEAKVQLEICKLNFNFLSKEKNVKTKIKKINDGIKYLDSAQQTGLSSSFNDLREKLVVELAEATYEVALQSEKDLNISEALKHYEKAKEYALQVANNKIKNKAHCRFFICKLKNGENIDNSDVIFNEIKKASQEIKYDFYFRFTISLLESHSFSEAEKIIAEQLNFTSPAIDQLKAVILAKKQKDAILRINEINARLSALYENGFPLNDLKTLYEKIDTYISEIKKIIPELTTKIRELRPSLFNRLLSYYISEQNFNDAISLIQNYPLFWKSPEILKNLGICCYGLTNQGNLTSDNYKSVISNWLTAVYSDAVILKSLEETSWDDEYTFTLTDSIGSNYQVHDCLPENVNHDEVSETNISIGATQRELLNQFESLLHQKLNDAGLIPTIQNFYDAEKQAIENIVQILDKNILFASPHFAKTYGINNIIIKHLCDDYDQYSNEESLKAGIPYVKESAETQVHQYNSAKALVDNLINAITKNDLAQVKLLNSTQNKNLITKFNNINSSLEDRLFNVFTDKIEENDENENLIYLMDHAIMLSQQNEKLKNQYSNYVVNYCIGKVNEEQMDHFTALNLMHKAYLYSPENIRICNNFITLIRFNLMDILNDRTKKSGEIYKILDDVYIKRSASFNQSSSELANTRTEILNQLKMAGVDITLLISSNRAFDSLLSPTGGHFLTAEGLKMKKVLDYLQKLSEGGTISRKDSHSNRIAQLLQQLGIQDDLPF